ncbi:Uncharacterised protein [Vibrio cholerae]|nr:Uncharacterised protein [Vibrio cholerae]CSI86310.1 Uncharacterised protein [Vibrio cholerae]
MIFWNIPTDAGDLPLSKMDHGWVDVTKLHLLTSLVWFLE